LAPVGRPFTREKVFTPGHVPLGCPWEKGCRRRKTPRLSPNITPGQKKKRGYPPKKGAQNHPRRVKKGKVKRRKVQTNVKGEKGPRKGRVPKIIKEKFKKPSNGGVLPIIDPLNAWPLEG